MGALKSFESLHKRPRLLFPKFVQAFVPIDTKNVRTKFEVRSFNHSWDNRGYSKNLGSPCISHSPFSPKICNGLLFRWTLWIYLPNLKFVALPIPEIIVGTPKIGESLDSPTLPILPNFKGLLFAWTLWIHLPNLKFLALPIPEIIGGTPKNWAVPGYTHALFSPKFFMGLCSDGPFECIGQICSPQL